MGDFRADIKIKMELMGKTYTQDMYINYFPNSDGVDDRVIEFFRDSYEDARARYDNMILDAEFKQRKKEQEDHDRKEY